MIKHLVIDEASDKLIDAQVKRVKQGEKTSPRLTRQVKELVYPVLNDYGINAKIYYGDEYYERELVRFKFVIGHSDVPEDLLKDVYEALNLKFKIKKLTYYEESDIMIIIWI